MKINLKINKLNKQINDLKNNLVNLKFFIKICKKEALILFLVQKLYYIMK